jgi:uncharacterized protein YjiS (DUF1127 family)
MATIGLSGGIAATIGNWAGRFSGELREEAARRRLYSRTFRELDGLNDRDLRDIGVSRLQIAEIAHEAAYGSHR